MTALYLPVDLVGFLPFAVEQVPAFVVNVVDMYIIPVAFSKRNPAQLGKDR
jgi:hypothetical protein